MPKRSRIRNLSFRGTQPTNQPTQPPAHPNSQPNQPPPTARLTGRHDFILLKVREVDGETATRVLIYDEHGHSKLEGGPLDINGTVKYEGIAFYR